MIVNTTLKKLAELNSTHKFWTNQQTELFISTEEKVCVVDFDLLLKIALGSNDCNRIDICKFLLKAEQEIEKQNENNKTT